MRPNNAMSSAALRGFVRGSAGLSVSRGCSKWRRPLLSASWTQRTRHSMCRSRPAPDRPTSDRLAAPLAAAESLRGTTGHLHPIRGQGPGPRGPPTQRRRGSSSPVDSATVAWVGDYCLIATLGKLPGPRVDRRVQERPAQSLSANTWAAPSLTFSSWP